MAFCPNCGSQLTDGAKFCMNCGHKIQDISRSTPPVNNVKQQESFESSLQNAFRGFIGAARNSIDSINANLNTDNKPIEEKKPPTIANCSRCGAPMNSFAARCPNCGSEYNNAISSTACQELCNRLDEIEGTRPKESFFTFAKGIADKMLDNHNISPTDQHKIELISSFIVPNTKADVLEFILLAQTKIDGCKTLAETTTDEYVSLVQEELMGVWENKLDQTIEKANYVLGKDSDFLAMKKKCLALKYQRNGLCQHCGGKLRGFITKTCTTCGLPKDY